MMKHVLFPDKGDDLCALLIAHAIRDASTVSLSLLIPWWQPPSHWKIGACQTTAGLSCCLCHHPEVLLHHYRLIVLSFPHTKIQRAYKNVTISILLRFQNCVSQSVSIFRLYKHTCVWFVACATLIRHAN
jgi:hypothetical protein